VHHEKSTLYTGTHFQEKTLATIMAEMGAPHIDIIRLDTEGAEWEVLTQWLMSGVMKKVNQLLIEVHDWGTDRYVITYFSLYSVYIQSIFSLYSVYIQCEGFAKLTFDRML
jgi:hypothetical protein